MAVVHFFENKSIVLSQLLRQVPSVDQNIVIKGRKGKVSSVTNVKENLFHVHVIFEPVSKKQPLLIDPKKKRR